MSAQKYYPGTQETEPFKSIVLELEAFDQKVFYLDSIKIGSETLKIDANKFKVQLQAPLKTPTDKATLFYSQRKKTRTLQIDSIVQLEPLYLP